MFLHILLLAFTLEYNSSFYLSYNLGPHIQLYRQLAPQKNKQQSENFREQVNNLLINVKVTDELLTFLDSFKRDWNEVFDKIVMSTTATETFKRIWSCKLSFFGKIEQERETIWFLGAKTASFKHRSSVYSKREIKCCLL